VGAWFSERQKPTAVLSPGPDLLWELFEVRETSDASAALAVGDHLLTLRLPAAVQEGMEQAAN
jgi:hypothetical protein